MGGTATVAASHTVDSWRVSPKNMLRASNGGVPPVVDESSRNFHGTKVEPVIPGEAVSLFEKKSPPPGEDFTSLDWLKSSAAATVPGHCGIDDFRLESEVCGQEFEGNAFFCDPFGPSLLISSTVAAAPRVALASESGGVSEQDRFHDDSPRRRGLDIDRDREEKLHNRALNARSKWRRNACPSSILSGIVPLFGSSLQRSSTATLRVNSNTF